MKENVIFNALKFETNLNISMKWAEKILVTDIYDNLISSIKQEPIHLLCVSSLPGCAIHQGRELKKTAPNKGRGLPSPRYTAQKDSSIA